ncbi:MAG: class I SAM-dependent methyltransferase [Planctomycetota bacterium]
MPCRLFNPTQQQIVDSLARTDRHERDAGIRNDLSLKALSPDVAELLAQLIVHRSARVVAEFGTSHGYSTLHLAAAADLTDGHVWSVESIPEKSALAAAHLADAGLSDRVSLVAGDGGVFADDLPHGIDLALIDYGIPAFAPAYDALRRRLAPGGLMFFDGGPDGYWQTDGIREFKQRLDDDPDLLVSLIAMRKQQLIAVRAPRIS